MKNQQNFAPFRFVLLFILSLFVIMCDESINEEQSVSEVQEKNSSNSYSSDRNSGSSELLVSPSVRQKDTNSGFSLAAESSSFLFELVCDGSKVFIQKSGDSAVVSQGDSCTGELKSFMLADKLYQRKDSSNIYKLDPNDQSEVGFVMDVTSSGIGQWDANSSYALVAHTVSSSSGSHDLSPVYEFSAVTVDDDDPNVATISEFEKSLEKDAAYSVEGHKAPSFRLAGQKDINKLHPNSGSIQDLEVLLLGEHFGSSVSFLIEHADSNTVTLGANEAKELTRESFKKDLLGGGSGETWNSKGLSYSAGFELQIKDIVGKSGVLIHVESLKNGKTNKLTLPLKLSEAVCPENADCSDLNDLKCSTGFTGDVTFHDVFYRSSCE